MPGDQIWPIVLLGISLLGNLILLFQKPIRRLLRREEKVSEDNIMAMVEEGEESGAIQSNEKTLIENVFDFDTMTARDVMVHRTDMVTLELDDDDDTVMETIKSSGLSRFPVYQEDKVSTDYILGLSTLSVRKSYDISELGLSEGAVRGLVAGTVDVQILNRLLEHRNFPKLMDLIRIYFQDTAAKGIMARNQLIELATASLSDLMKEHPEHRAEAKQDLQLLNAQKMGEHEAEIEKIKNVFLAILRDIKKDMDNREQPGEAVTAAMFQTMQETMKDHQQELLSMDDVTAMIAGQIGKFLPMDEETAEQFRQLAKRMMEQVGK